MERREGSEGEGRTRNEEGRLGSQLVSAELEGMWCAGEGGGVWGEERLGVEVGLDWWELGFSWLVA